MFVNNFNCIKKLISLKTTYELEPVRSMLKVNNKEDTHVCV